MGKKTKVFLGAFVNYTNAQNLNCLALAKYLDKTKYDVRTGIGYSGDLPVENIPGVRYYKMRYPARIWGWICLLRGILWCDVAYLPTPMHWKFCWRLLKIFHKPSFKTVEGMMIGTNITKMTQGGMTLEDIKIFESFTSRTYSITGAMRLRNKQAIDLDTEKRILYLGVDSHFFSNKIPRKKLTDIAIVGGNLFYKGLDIFFDIAKRFPDLRFHVIGSGMGNVNPGDEIKRLGLSNAVWHGNETHEQLKESLKKIQLHLFPSRAEGFPKVILETAAAGIPSIVFGDYGAEEWITTRENGFVVNTPEEMTNIIEDLLEHPEKLQDLAENSCQLAHRFDWKIVIRDWEDVIDELVSR